MTKRTWTILIIVVTSTISVDMLDFATTTESSADYLRKVMIELRGLNVPTSLDLSPSAEPVYFDVDDRRYLAGKRFSNGKRHLRPVVEHQDNSALPILRSTGKKFSPDNVFSESATHNRYYQIPGPVVLAAPKKQSPEAQPALTKAQLASMFTNPMDKESAITLNALANVLRTRLPTVPPNPVQVVAPAQPMYSYYFYPLKTFMNDMRHPNDLQTMPDTSSHDTGLMHETEKQAANPLFMAISGFVGMAVLFMVGVLLMPRLVGDFRSRDDEDDDYLELTKTINEAIDKRNCTEHKRADKRTVFTTRPMSRPSSVVLLSTKSYRLKDIAKRRRKIRKSHRGIAT